MRKSHNQIKTTITILKTFDVFTGKCYYCTTSKISSAQDAAHEAMRSRYMPAEIKSKGQIVQVIKLDRSKDE